MFKDRLNHKDMVQILTEEERLLVVEALLQHSRDLFAVHLKMNAANPFASCQYRQRAEKANEIAEKLKKKD